MVEGDNNNFADDDRQAQIEAVWQRIQQRSGAKPAVIKEALETENNQDKTVVDANKLVSTPDKRSKKPLVIICIIICIIILLVVVGVTVTGFFTNWFGLVQPNRTNKVTMQELIDTSKQMPGVKFEDISDTTKVTILSANIQEKLDGYQDYTTEKAIADYKQAYDIAEGNLKLYIALEYAHYLYENTENLNQAVEIIDSVKDNVNENNQVDYYSSLLNLYTMAGMEDKITEYQNKLEEVAPDANVDKNLLW